MLHRSYLFLYIFTLFILGCKKEEKQQATLQDTSGGTYFSILQFAKDQFDTYLGQPFTLEKIITLNDSRDSSMVPAYTVDWASVVQVFAESDISHPKYLGRYDFTVFDDDATDSRTFYYEAKDPDLFTRSLQISVDPTNNKIKSIFIETAREGRFSSKRQKLYYAPVRVLQIQESETAFLGKDKNLRIEYRFLY